MIERRKPTNKSTDRQGYMDDKRTAKGNKRGRRYDYHVLAGAADGSRDN
jgi:hypothetical protein